MSEWKNDGGPAFPFNELNQQTGGVFSQHMGMSLRAYFAAHAPVTFEMACSAYGEKPEDIRLHDDATRRAFFAVLTLLRAEYADAMIAELEGAE